MEKKQYKEGEECGGGVGGGGEEGGAGGEEGEGEGEREDEEEKVKMEPSRCLTSWNKELDLYMPRSGYTYPLLYCSHLQKTRQRSSLLFGGQTLLYSLPR